MGYEQEIREILNSSKDPLSRGSRLSVNLAMELEEKYLINGENLTPGTREIFETLENEQDKQDFVKGYLSGYKEGKREGGNRFDSEEEMDDPDVEELGEYIQLAIFQQGYDRGFEMGYASQDPEFVKKTVPTTIYPFWSEHDRSPLFDSPTDFPPKVPVETEISGQGIIPPEVLEETETIKQGIRKNEGGKRLEQRINDIANGIGAKSAFSPGRGL